MRMQPGPRACGRRGATHGAGVDAGDALLDPKAPSPAEDLGEDAPFLLDEPWDSDEDCQRAKRRPPGCGSCLLQSGAPNAAASVSFWVCLTAAPASHVAIWKLPGR